MNVELTTVKPGRNNDCYIGFEIELRGDECRGEVKNQCRNSKEYREWYEKRMAAVKAVKELVGSLDVDDEWKRTTIMYLPSYYTHPGKTEYLFY